MSTTMRFNITLPTDIGIRLKSYKNQSRLIADSLRDTFAREEQERLNSKLAEGYSARARDDTSLNKEFDHTISDGIEE